MISMYVCCVYRACMYFINVITHLCWLRLFGFVDVITSIFLFAALILILTYYLVTIHFAFLLRCCCCCCCCWLLLFFVRMKTTTKNENKSTGSCRDNFKYIQFFSSTMNWLSIICTVQAGTYYHYLLLHRFPLFPIPIRRVRFSFAFIYLFCVSVSSYSLANWCSINIKYSNWPHIQNFKHTV